MDDLILRIITAFKRKPGIRKIKKRSPIQRLKSRQYYRTHKSRIKFLRSRKKTPAGVYKSTRKLFKRSKPSWAVHKTKIIHHKPIKPPKPKKRPIPKRPKFHVPKRKTS